MFVTRKPPQSGLLLSRTLPSPFRQATKSVLIYPARPFRRIAYNTHRYCSYISLSRHCSLYNSAQTRRTLAVLSSVYKHSCFSRDYTTEPDPEKKNQENVAKEKANEKETENDKENQSPSESDKKSEPHEQETKKSKDNFDPFFGFRRKKGDKDKDERPEINYRKIAVVAGGCFATLLFIDFLFDRLENIGGKAITLDEFRQMVKEGNVREIIIDVKQRSPDEYPTEQTKYLVSVFPKITDHDSTYRYFYVGNVETFEKQLEESQYLLDVPSTEYIPVKYRTTRSIKGAILSIAGFAMIILLLSMFFPLSVSNMGMGFGRSNAKLFRKDEAGKIKVTFSDVAGLDEAKEEIMEFVSFLKNPEKYAALGAKIPKGALLVGPPGTGKTLLAKAAAGEASVPFYTVSGSDFVEMFVGVGPARVRDLFKSARQNTPCIIFIDEIDAVGRKREVGFRGSHDEREATLNQLLVEMDGFNTSKGVVVLAGTNRPDVLDQALLRPGRFDRQIALSNPDVKAREQIFGLHLKPLKLSKTVSDYAPRLAELTPGFSGADIANVCNEAALIAARKGLDSVDFPEMEAAIDRVIGGLEKKNKVMSLQEKRIVAHHEAGHAIAGWFLEHTDPLLKVSIVPRGTAALGFAQYIPKETYLKTQEELFDMMCKMLAGRVAEELVFGKNVVSTGAQDDLEKVTKLAYGVITQYGMNDSVGMVSFEKEEGAVSKKPFSDATSEMIDHEARLLVDQAYRRTEELLRGKLAELKTVGEELLHKEVLRREDLERLVGPRPVPVKDSFLEELRQQEEEEKKKEEEERKKEEEEEKKRQDQAKEEEEKKEGKGPEFGAVPLT